MAASDDGPWEAWSDEEQPWRDLDRVSKLDEMMDGDAEEMAAALGCAESTARRWRDKAREETAEEFDEEELQCRHFEICQNHVDHGHLEVCGDCLDRLRWRDSGLIGDSTVDYESDPVSHMSDLYASEAPV